MKVADTETTVLITGESGTGKGWSLGIYTALRVARAVPSSRSTVPHCPSSYSSRSSSATSRAASADLRTGSTPHARLAGQCPRASQRHRARGDPVRGWLVTNEHLPITVTHSVRTDRAVPPLVSAEFPLKGIRLAAVERDLLGKALKQAKNNKSQAVTVLGLGQGQFYSLLKRHGMTDAKR